MRTKAHVMPITRTSLTVNIIKLLSHKLPCQLLAKSYWIYLPAPIISIVCTHKTYKDPLPILRIRLLILPRNEFIKRNAYIKAIESIPSITIVIIPAP